MQNENIEDENIQRNYLEENNPESKKDSRRKKYIIVVLVVLILLLLILILFLYLIRGPLIFRSGAYSSDTTITVSTPRPAGRSGLSLDNSYVFASPLRAKVGGEQIRITVFILDDRGLGLSGKTVSLGRGSQLQVTSVQPVTDAQGRATFDVASESAPGVYIIEAAVDGATLIQKATITFD